MTSKYNYINSQLFSNNPVAGLFLHIKNVGISAKIIIKFFNRTRNFPTIQSIIELQFRNFKEKIKV